jgi:hypothetical protein
MNSMLNRTLEKKLSPISNFIVPIRTKSFGYHSATVCRSYDRPKSRLYERRPLADFRLAVGPAISYVDDDSKSIWFWDGSTPLGTASGQKTTIFQKLLEMYHFGRSYLII